MSRWQLSNKATPVAEVRGGGTTLMAPNRLGAMYAISPKQAQKRTCLRHVRNDAFDPCRSSGAIFCCGAQDGSFQPCASQASHRHIFLLAARLLAQLDLRSYDSGCFDTSRSGRSLPSICLWSSIAVSRLKAPVHSSRPGLFFDSLNVLIKHTLSSSAR
jgi:hypothetical protein